jgi:DNA-binding XRE family transcriptional regulator
MPVAIEAASLATNIKARRAKIETNQQTFAANVNVRYSTFIEIEAGRFLNPPQSILERIAEGLDCEVEDLLPLT